MDKLNKGTKIVYKLEFNTELGGDSTPEQIRLAVKRFMQVFGGDAYPKQVRCLSIEVDGKRLGD